MHKWDRVSPWSKDLILLEMDEEGLIRLEELVNDVYNEYLDFPPGHIKKEMINGLLNFTNSCKAQRGKIVFPYKIYSNMLRWITTTNPRYVSSGYDRFREAMKKLWNFLFFNCLKEFRYPDQTGTYIDDDEKWNDWFACIKG